MFRVGLRCAQLMQDNCIPNITLGFHVQRSKE